MPYLKSDSRVFKFVFRRSDPFFQSSPYDAPEALRFALLPYHTKTTKTMTTGQINKTNMYQTTDLVLSDPVFQPIWSALPAFVRGQANLEGSINVLAALAQSQGTVLKGITLDKNRLKLTLVSRTLIVAGAAGAFAFESGNQTLAAKFNVNEGGLKNTRESLLDDAAQVIHDEALKLVTANPTKMTDYNLTPVMLTDLQSANTAYSATLGTPRAAIAGRSGATAAIAAEIEAADANLENILDRLILQFAENYPNFTTAYATARKIVNAGGGHAVAPEPTTKIPPVA